MTLIMLDGTINYLCSSKCRKNLLMKRRKVRWVTKNEESKKILAQKVSAKAAAQAQAQVKK
jgi:ribosomal protein L24E